MCIQSGFDLREQGRFVTVYTASVILDFVCEVKRVHGAE